MEATGSTNVQVVVTLTGSEALVLSDVLARWDADGTTTALGPAARRVVQEMTAVLEPTIDPAFSADYANYLRRAQEEVLSA
jgi:hypothetical protein